MAKMTVLVFTKNDEKCVTKYYTITDDIPEDVVGECVKDALLWASDQVDQSPIQLPFSVTIDFSEDIK